jgi:hypothetical protein
LPETQVSGRSIVKAFCWLFASLVMVALLSQPGATHDEWFHASSIWCGHGVRAPQCVDISDVEGVRIATTNMNPFNCQRVASDVLHCPIAISDQGSSVMNKSSNPSWFYFVLSWAVVSSPEASFASVRVASALIISLMFALVMWLLPSRHRIAMTLVALTTFSATGFFLFSSINSSSWTAAGIGGGWFALHAAAASSQLSRRRRAALLGAGIIASLMAIGSRYDAIPFVVFVVILICISVLWTRFTNRRKEVLVAACITSFLSLIVIEVATPTSPLFHLSLLYKFSEGQPDNTTFFTHNILQGLPNALLALGTVPTMSQVILPQLVFVVSIASLAILMWQTFERRNMLQMSGFLVAWTVISLAIATQVAYNDQRNQGFIEARYVFPLLLFAVGWWFLQGPYDLRRAVSSHLKPVALASTGVFFLTMFTVAERFVDRQTFGVRYLPEGPDQWWWTWLPVGPNVLVVLATCCVWMFFRQLIINENHADALKV